MMLIMLYNSFEWIIKYQYSIKWWNVCTRILQKYVYICTTKRGQMLHEYKEKYKVILIV